MDGPKRNAELPVRLAPELVADTLADRITADLEREIATLRASGELRVVVDRAVAKAAERGALRGEVLVSAMAGILVLHVRRSRSLIRARSLEVLEAIQLSAIPVQLVDRPRKGPIDGSACERRSE